MSKIVFLELRLFRNSMIETYQINHLKEMGHQVEIWHLGSLFGVGHNVRLNAPAIMEYLVKINTFDELKEKVSQLERRSILFSTLGLLYYYPVLYRILKKQDDFIWIGRITKKQPTGKGKGNKQNAFKAAIGSVFFFKLYRPFSNVISYFVQKLIRKYGPAVGLNGFQTDYLMVSNRKQVPPSFPEEKVILTHADDYNIHLLNEGAVLDPSLQDAIVFLDQMIYFHPDFKKLGEDMMDVDTYYLRLNKVLDDISGKYGKQVVVAGHPEADKHQGYAERFKGKKFVIGKSVTLVKHASLVLTHYSTAVSFAVIYNKPLMLLSCNGFETFSKIMRPISTFAEALHVPIINMDNYDLNNLDLMEPDYKVYKDNYIKSDNTPEELSYPYAVKYVLNQYNLMPSKQKLVP